MKNRFFIELVYSDDSEFGFNVEIDGSPSAVVAQLMMITRGTLMASMACRATCYNSEGFDVCAYTK